MLTVACVWQELTTDTVPVRGSSSECHLKNFTCTLCTAVPMVPIEPLHFHRWRLSHLERQGNPSNSTQPDSRNCTQVQTSSSPNLDSFCGLIPHLENLVSSQCICFLKQLIHEHFLKKMTKGAIMREKVKMPTIESSGRKVPMSPLDWPLNMSMGGCFN